MLFRSVENRRPVVRSANTGVSGFISPRGEVRDTVQDDKGKRTFVDGTAFQDVGLSAQKTFYTKFGDVFTLICFACILWGTFRKK